MASMVKNLVSSARSQTLKVVGNSACDSVISKVAQAKPVIPMSNTLLKNNFLQGNMSARYAHTDLQVPDFSDYRIAPSKGAANFHEKERERKLERKSFYYTVTAGCGIGGVYLAKAIVSTVIDYVGPSADVLALGSTEVPLDAVPEGKSMTFSWRGKPLFIRHRTDAEIAREEAVNVAELRDPETDAERVQESKWLVVIGVCTHLGCVPIADAGDYGGYYCPCHGSHYDGSGRIRRGPAPRNLEVPTYKIIDDSFIRVG